MKGAGQLAPAGVWLTSGLELQRLCGSDYFLGFGGASLCGAQGVPPGVGVQTRSWWCKCGILGGG